MMTANKAWMAGVLLACAGSVWAQATQPAETAAPAESFRGQGTVTGDNVYVRSGFSTNYYPVLKLHTGDKVNVLRSEFGWLEIAPPEGAFSLVEKSRIDKKSENEGVANDLVQVYAGSDLDDRRYAKQVKLERGDAVRIIGETADGDFYKITPPPGSTVWISADFVRRGSGGAFAGDSGMEPVKPGELSKAQAEIARKLDTDKPSKAAPAPVAPPAPKPQPKLTEVYSDQIKAIEAEIADESRKAPTDQQLEPIVGKLAVLAEQEEDIVASTYAKARIEQLTSKMAIAAALMEMKQLREDAVSQADEIARRRAEEKARNLEFTVDDIAARGQIKVSGLYDGSGGKARRWRLVDPKTARTIAYMELAPGSNIDPVKYYGKYVGVRATSYQLLHGTVPPLPVYVVNSIEPQDPDRPKSGIIRKEAIASPEPRIVPASQPSVSPAPSTRPAAQ